MRKKYFLLLLAGLLLVSLLAGCQPAGEEPGEESTYPDRNIIAVVGFSPGGPTDVIARGVLPIVQEELGVGIGINNMAGAASAPAAEHVLAQKSDGYTIFFGSEIMSVWQTMGTTNLSPTEDFIPVKIVSEAIPVLAVPPDSPFNSVEELIAYAKEHPGELRISTAGPGTVPHVSGLLLQQYLDVEFTFVPYQGGKPAVIAVMSSEVDATIEMVQSMVSEYEGGQLNILACFTNEPIDDDRVKDVPPIGQIYPELSKHLPYGPYFGVFVSKDCPAEVVEVWEAALDKAIADPRWIEYTDQFLLVRVDYSGEEAIDYLKKWTSRAAWLLYDFGAAENSPEEFGIPRLEE
ncbi:MAG: tripartite tricarboxylate transporter substrate binding protein [Dethiobacteria bacterium]|nr:tripartite tricarboxylate transporter substrate binding protein [Bacillota bacterium]HOA36540.1 tripartite tricarboxylate transporter substrate binding protein [Bacillota bacterium]HOJ83504.1 tripartite tricarboxylate transporter substrate binding protein [Bacillota bacterium]HOL14818.1 tripartite tricarboxylate transporter substrate binding protein [Bacillota bacterium]HQE10842.1 tripartite tricarboxylate transporter substrate binding protein [Bacillota bacterium]